MAEGLRVELSGLSHPLDIMLYSGSQHSSQPNEMFYLEYMEGNGGGEVQSQGGLGKRQMMLYRCWEQ